MRNRFVKSDVFVIFVFAAASLLILFSQTAAAQTTRVSTPDLDRRLANEKNIRDNERLRRGMEADEEARAKTKEERQAIVSQAFMRVQVLHNEIMAMVISSKSLDLGRVTDAVAETKKRAIELRANLVLPKPSKDEKKEKNEGTVVGDDLKISLERLCAHIKSFVVNLNSNPTDTKSLEQARRELDLLISQSDKLTADVLKAVKRDN